MNVVEKDIATQNAILPNAADKRVCLAVRRQTDNPADSASIQKWYQAVWQHAVQVNTHRLSAVHPQARQAEEFGI